jgi:hypothetical protein
MWEAAPASALITELAAFQRTRALTEPATALAQAGQHDRGHAPRELSTTAARSMTTRNDRAGADRDRRSTVWVLLDHPGLPRLRCSNCSAEVMVTDLRSLTLPLLGRVALSDLQRVADDLLRAGAGRALPGDPRAPELVGAITASRVESGPFIPYVVAFLFGLVQQVDRYLVQPW